MAEDPSLTAARPDPGGRAAWAVVFRWAWVTIPLAWGVSRTVLTSLDLFK